MTHAVNAETVLSADVATSGTFTVPYPIGTTAGDFAAGNKHVLSTLKKLWEYSRDFTLTFNAANATVTWQAANTLPAGAKVKVQFDKVGGLSKDFALVGSALTLTRVPRCAPLEDRVVSIGSPVASDDDALFASASFVGTPTLITAGKTFDVPRNVIITSDGNESGKTFTVLGADEYGQTVTEVITGPNATVVGGIKAFKTITSITVAASPSAGNVKVGYGNVFGLPIHLPAIALVPVTLQDGAVPSNAPTLVAGLNSLTKPTGTNADVRGTFAPNSNAANVPNGARGYTVILSAIDPTFIGNPQFAG